MKHIIRTLRWREMLVLCLAFSSGFASSALASEAVEQEAMEREAVYEQAKVAMREGRTEAAYQLLAQHEINWSGEDAFDYLLGVAALDSGHSGDAIFSLQRLVARRPAFAGARLELARAFYDVGDNELARIEFERVQSENPPANVAQTVNDYMTAINNKSREYQASSQYFIEIGGGYDSNAPAATDENVFLNFVLNPTNLEQSSAFAKVRVGGLWNKPISASSQLLFNARLDHRANPSTHFVDGSNIDLGAAWSWKSGENSASIAANTLFSALDGEYNKSDIGVMGTYARQLTDSWGFTGFVRAGAIRFDQQILQIRDVDQVLYGLRISQSYSSAQMSLSVTANSDDAVDATEQFSADGYTVRFTNNWYRKGGSVISFDASATNTEFDNQFFGFEREDDLYAVTLGSAWSQFPAKGWVTTLNLNYSVKDSTVSLYEFDRLEVGVTLRKVFD
jgi:tetratricopeptide (TPR) repeat protein